MPKKIILDQDALQKLLTGADALADIVCPTLGPRGRNALLTRRDEQTGAAQPPLVTNDGATIAQAISLADPMEEMGVQLLREASVKTNKSVGDGTTTATVLARALLHGGYRNIAAGADPLQIRTGMTAAAQAAWTAMEQCAVPVKGKADIGRVASISCGEEQLGNLIADALEQVGTHGVVTVEDSTRFETVLEFAEGMRFSRGILTPNFWKPQEEREITLQNPYVLVTDKKISQIQDLVPILEDIINEPQPRPLLIIAEEVTGEALATLIMNRKQCVIEVLCIHPPEFGEGRSAMMEDIAILTGGVFLSDTFGHVLPDTTLDMLGSADSVKIDDHSTIIVGGHFDPATLKRKTDSLKQLIETTDYEFKNKRYRERLARLTGGIAVLKVGGVTETEIRERKLRAEDAVHAAQAAMAKGIVPGGGTAYLRVIPAVEQLARSLSGDQRTGAMLLAQALEAPVRQIAANAGVDPGETVSKVKGMTGSMGFDAAALQYTNLLERGILDPVLVVKSALQSAVSVAATVLTAAAGVVEMGPAKKE